MLTELYIEALLVNEKLADQVRELWAAGDITDSASAWARRIVISVKSGGESG